MHPEPSDSQLAVRDTTRRFLETTVPLQARTIQAPLTGPALRSFWRQATDVGVASLLLPEALGGLQADDAVGCLAVVAGEFGRIVAPGPLVGANVVVDTLVRLGTDAQRRDVAKAIAAGDVLATWAPGPHSLKGRRTRGGLVLDGVCSPVEAAAEADVVLVAVAGEGGPLQLLVPLGAPGVTVSPLVSVDLARTFAEVAFEGVILDATAQVGSDPASPGDLDHQVDLALCLQAAETAAAMEAVFDLTVEYLKDRYAFGRTIASYQAIKHRLADHKMWLEVALGLADALARAFDADERGRSRLASTAKVQVAEHALNTVSDCSQLLGGISMTWDHVHHFFLRRISANWALYGTPADHRERLCRLAGL